MSSSSVLGCPVGGGGRNEPAQGPSTSTIVLGDTMKGSHVVTIDGYSRLKGLGGNDGFFKSGGFLEPYFNSGKFHIGGHTWVLTYSSEGHGIAQPDCISLYLRLVQYHFDTRNRIRISCCLLLDHDGQIVPSHTWEIDDFTSSCIKGRPVWGIEKKVLEESPYLIDDRFRVRCEIVVQSNVRTQNEQLIAVPPSDMHQHIGHLLSWQEGVDVTFEVDGETFSAHRLVLAVRSVFKAQLFGPMKEKRSHIRVDDMKAGVFKAMLHFIYNDALPDIDREDMPAMAQHLLVVADRYGLERLKAICEDKLWYNISTSTLASTLAIAEQHGCRELKEACFEFMMKSTRNLDAVLDGDGFQHLLRIFPTFPKELVEKHFHTPRIQ